MRKPAGVADGEAVGVAENPVEPLLDDLVLGESNINLAAPVMSVARSGWKNAPGLSEVCDRKREALSRPPYPTIFAA